MSGPYGRFVLHTGDDRPAVLVGGGTGTAPLKSMVLHALETEGYDAPLTLYAGGRTRAWLYDVDVFRRLAKEHPDRFTYRPCLSEETEADVAASGDDPSAYAYGNVTDVPAADHVSLSGCRLLSGPPAMVEAALRTMMGKRLFPVTSTARTSSTRPTKAAGGVVAADQAMSPVTSACAPRRIRDGADDCTVSPVPKGLRGGERPGRRRLRSVGTALDVLECFAIDGSLGVSDVARRLGIGKATAHRLLQTLATRGFVEQDRGDRQVPAGHAPLRARPPGAGAQHVPARGALHLQAIAAATGYTVNFSVPDGVDVVFVERIRRRVRAVSCWATSAAACRCTAPARAR